jgi:hypothetical protein
VRSKPAAAALSVEVGSAASGLQEIECEGARREIGEKEVGGGGQEERERERDVGLISTCSKKRLGLLLKRSNRTETGPSIPSNLGVLNHAVLETASQASL